MPANIGEMFYYGEVPWHLEGTPVEEPLTVNEAIELGGLDWEVEKIKIQTAESPPSPTSKRIAIVRKDKAPGDKGRVLGIAHKNFEPLQNRTGAEIFDSIFGKGEKVYHTGGYLGHGEVVWLLAKLPRTIEVTEGDKIYPYALFSNSHDGTQAIDFRLTTVRVVCQNTLTLALKNKELRTFFKKGHKGNYYELRDEVESFFSDTLKAVDDLSYRFKVMNNIWLEEEEMENYIRELLPDPIRPASAEKNPAVKKSYKTRLENTKLHRKSIMYLVKNGKGTELPGISETLWGGFNAVLEYMDHHYDENKQNLTQKKVEKQSLAQGLFSTKTTVKRKAFEVAEKIITEKSK